MGEGLSLVPPPAHQPPEKSELFHHRITMACIWLTQKSKSKYVPIVRITVTA